ncbi:LiaF transmembrane domain-containing protein [Liquorilactobacillus capillatus]|uniref:LiaF transmembrane domain-containing protein n=1 Tax=Liquorilactobacillus capillatus DSM 19910 TaxID=1423731 RepID=A0A0R1M6P4_9LACO|nr:hypothetical protein [Liquorilactobacillus capillatus]KRL03553.1 hypothetical protein FC81_GL001807 [Liquorilactobacillus capillatus DSM 19910]
MKRQRWFWGLLFLMSAVVLIAGQMGWISAQVSLWSIIITLFLIAALVQSLMHKAIAGIVFSLAFLSILYAEPLGIKHLVPWTILGAAVLVSIGLSLLFQTRPAAWSWGSHKNSFSRTTEARQDDSYVQLNGNMNSSIQYVQSKNFKRADIDASFSGMKVYFDNAVIAEDSAEINISAAYSGVELYFPKEWRVIDQVDSFLSGLDEKRRATVVNGPTVFLKGSLRLSGVTIHYV